VPAGAGWPAGGSIFIEAEVVMPRVLWVVLLALNFCSVSWAGEDMPETLSEEMRAENPNGEADESGESEAEEAEDAPPPQPAEPALPQAENVDLKEVISKPLHEVLPIRPVEPEPLESPVETSTTPLQSEIDGQTSPQPVEPQQQAQPLRMLGAEVLPGTTTRLAWSVKDSLAGISVPTPVLVVHGQKPGPRVCITSAVHGDELNGIEVVRRVMYDLQPDKLSGTVIGVPIVNLQGFRRTSRYLEDRRDLNRYFPGHANGSSAARIAHSFFSEVVQHCQYLVDLHTGSFRRTNLPQLRADLTNPAVAEMTRNMGAMVVLQSRGTRGSLRRAAVDVGIPSVTLEAGEPLIVEASAVQLGVQSIQTLLSRMHMYPYKGVWARKSEPVYYRSRWVRATSGGILINTVRLGERVKKGQLLGVVTDPITNASTQIHSPLAGRMIGMALNQVMLPGFAAYHIGYQATAEEAAETDAGPDETAGDDAEVEESEDGFGPALPVKKPQ
jgi:predicted deacylase